MNYQNNLQEQKHLIETLAFYAWMKDNDFSSDEVNGVRYVEFGLYGNRELRKANDGLEPKMRKFDVIDFRLKDGRELRFNRDVIPFAMNIIFNKRAKT